jgi:fumarate reductase (CoM/CoB) subunit B
MPIPSLVKLSIQRTAEIFQTFDVPYHEGMSVLDALKIVSATEAPDLAYRWECGGQRICGVCTIKVNGSPVLACGVSAQPGHEYVLEPLDGFPVEQDLVIDLTDRLAQMNAQRPYLVEGGRPIATQQEAEASKLLRSCIECWACVSVCPVSLETDNAHALGMVKLARFALDPRDGADRSLLVHDAGLDQYSVTCPGCRRCMEVCPKGIDVFADAIQVLEGLETHEQH